MVETYGDYPKYVTSDDEMIIRMLDLHLDKNKLHNKKTAQLVQSLTVEYKIDNSSVYSIHDQICEETNLYPHVKQHKSKRDSSGAFDAIHSRLVGPSPVKTVALEAEFALQMSTYDGEKKA